MQKIQQEVKQWAETHKPATWKALESELQLQYSDEVEIDSAEFEASVEREQGLWEQLAKDMAGWLFGLRKEAQCEFEADTYALMAVEIAKEYGVQPEFAQLRDMVEWHQFSR